jgi:hypothetical protein
MPEPLTPEQLENATRMAATVVEVFGDDWDLHYIDGSEVSCRTDYDNPFEGSYVEVFNTSQWPEGKDHSPVAEFLCESIVMVPRLVGEVDRLTAENATLREKAENRLIKLADIERAYRKVGNKAGAARQDYAAAEIRAIFGIEWKPGGEPRA